MRFLVGGPSIPDELLVARDEGRVVFFCGAGVSRACAGLPDFFGLAKNVSEKLGIAPDSPAKKLIEEAREIAIRLKESGLISADRVFGLLEREFTVSDIHAAVAKSLTPTRDVDLSAHRVMLDLAKGADGKVRLITTNFDRLFEECDNTVQCWQPPRLPDLLLHDELDGIVHLHGRVNADYSGAEGDGFVLSSSEFGRAYLSDAWATEFIRTILDTYIVVFVGYTADDPPVQYLLEALNHSHGPRTTIYAFQPGDHSDAQSKWLHKGVQPIAYEEEENHRALWDTLNAWSKRARNVEAWYQDIVSLARGGPETLAPHERGQIAHVVSTLEGLRRFSFPDEPPPAEWLCVFDTSVRYSKPRHEFNLGENGSFIDPFALYGLDSDVVPENIGSEDHYVQRDIPKDAWDCFGLTPLDRHDILYQNLPAMKGYLSTHTPKLPARLWQLGIWLQKVSHQPAAVWWAAGQNGIHPDIQQQIWFELVRGGKSTSAEIRKAWSNIFESWDTNRSNFSDDWFELKATIALDGWSNSAIRTLASILKPYLVAERPWGSPRPPQSLKDPNLRDMVNLDVKYPDPHEKIQIPDEYLLLASREFRQNLELAVILERELGGYGLSNLAPIEDDPSLKDKSTSRTYGIYIVISTYIELFRKLTDIDVNAAKQEYLTWWSDDETIFASLRIWAGGDKRLLSGPDSGELLSGLSNNVFWSASQQRDLLLTLAKRWVDFPLETQIQLGNRLLRGPPRWDNEENENHIERRAWEILSRIHWLNGQGCKFSFSIEAVSVRFRALVPEWKPEYGEKAAASFESISGNVETVREFTPLLFVPLANVLNVAAEFSSSRQERFIRSDPFAGLSSSRPIRAFSALTISGKHGDFPEWAWRTFLNPETRKLDKPKLSALIAERVSTIPKDSLELLINSVTDWLLKASDNLLKYYPKQFERVWKIVLLVLQTDTERGHSSVIRGNKEPDWATEALNSPVGKLAQSLMNDPQKENLKVGGGFSSSWISRVDELLSLVGDLRRHALVIFSFNLQWFYGIDAAWTERQLLSGIDTVREDQAAVWAGFFWRAKIPGEKLYLRLKPRLLELAKSKFLLRRGHIDVLSSTILAGWGNKNSKTGQREVTDQEMRDVLLNSDEAFRLHILWQLGKWSEGDKQWLEQLGTFLIEVWPRQNKAKSPKVSARLCELALTNLQIFSEIVDIVLPLLTKADGVHLLLQDLSKTDSVAERYPGKTLILLFAILPDDISTWPYQIDEVLERIGLADNSLLSDHRLLELKRRWNSR